MHVGFLAVFVLGMTHDFHVECLEFSVKVRSFKPSMACNARHLVGLMAHQRQQISFFRRFPNLPQRFTEVNHHVGAGNHELGHLFLLFLGVKIHGLSRLNLYGSRLILGKGADAIFDVEAVANGIKELLHGNRFFQKCQSSEFVASTAVSMVP